MTHPDPPAAVPFRPARVLRTAKWLTAGALGAAAAAGGYSAHQRAMRAWRTDGEELVSRGLSLPVDIGHRFVPVDDGGRLHVMERGTGPAVVLVHGVTLSGALWVKQFRGLTGRRVLAVDVRGHGQSITGGDPITFDRLGVDLLSVLQELGVTGAVLVGHSMGGMVAMDLAARRGAELSRHVRALVLMSTSAHPARGGPGGNLLLDPFGRGAARLMRGAERRGGGLLPQGDLATWVARWNFGAEPQPAEIELVRSIVSAMSPSSMASFVGPLLRFDRRRELPRIDLPTVVVSGARDRLVPLRAGRDLARGIAGARHAVLGGIGHLPMLEAADAVAELLTEQVAPGPG